jgi:hypothetical protein
MKEIINKVIKLPETPNEYARDMINKYYYTLPNNGSPNVGINSCESRYKEAIECATPLFRASNPLPIGRVYIVNRNCSRLFAISCKFSHEKFGRARYRPYIYGKKLK